MKKGLRNLLVAGSMLFGVSAFSQEKSDTINVENISMDVFKQTPYGKTITEDFLKNTPENLKRDSVSNDELKLFYLDVATDYRKVSVKYGNLQKDYSGLEAKKDAEHKKAMAALRDSVNKEVKNYQKQIKELQQTKLAQTVEQMKEEQKVMKEELKVYEARLKECEADKPKK